LPETITTVIVFELELELKLLELLETL